MKYYYLLPALLLCLHNSLATASCEVVSLQVLGSGGPELDDGRASSSYLLWQDGQARVLIDTGPGSASNFEKSGAHFEDLQAILFTHLHVDHSADFPSYIKGSYFTARDTDLTVLGPAGNSLMPATSIFVDRQIGPTGAYPYLANYLQPGQQSAYKVVPTDAPINDREVHHYTLSPAITASSVAVHHGPIAAVAWRVNVGRCSVTFSGDMNNEYQTLADLALDTDLLVIHNAVPESAAGVATQLHMRPSEIGRIAHNAKAKQLLISHRMTRTLGQTSDTLRLIREHYQGPVSFAEDLAVITP